MALIICQECGKEYSNKASSCPNCGCPTTFNCSQKTYEDSTSTDPIAYVRTGDASLENSLRKTPKRSFCKTGIIIASVIALIVGILAVVVYVNSDANIEQKLIGTWRIESVDGKEEGIAAVGLEFFDDGSFFFMINGEVIVSQWKLKNNKKLWLSFGDGTDEIYDWGKDSEENEWYMGRGVLRLGKSEFRKTDEHSSEAEKDIAVVNKLMEAAEKTALTMDYGEYGLCFVIKIDNDECDVSVTKASFPRNCLSEWKTNAGIDGEFRFKLKSSIFHTTGGDAQIIGIIDSNRSVKWLASRVTVPFSLRKWFE